MKVISWNVNSVRSRLERLLGVLERHEPDVVCLQELKCVDEQFPWGEVRSAGYHAVTHAQPTYNGVAILSREEATEVERGFNDGDEEDPQARLIWGTVGGTRVCSAYVPNGQKLGSEKWVYKLAWYARLRAKLASMDLSLPLAIAGDYNVAPEASDVAHPEKWEESVLFAPEARAALRSITELGFVDTFRKHHPDGGVYSWWDYRRLAFPKGDGLRIDHVLATEPLAARSTGASIDREERKGKLPSDHAPVVVEFE